MSTENEEWREDSKSENTDAGRDGNRSFNREGGYSRPSYNREGGDRPYRPRFNSNSEDRPQRSYGDRPIHAPEAAARQIDDIFRGIHIGDLLVGPVKSRSVHVCFLSALFLRHSLLPDSAAAEQQHRGEKKGQYASIHRVSSFQGNQGSLRPLPAGGNAMARSRRFFKSRVSPYRRRASAR